MCDGWSKISSKFDNNQTFYLFIVWEKLCLSYVVSVKVWRSPLVSRGGVLLFIIVRICTVYTDNFWALCIARYSEEKVPFSVLKWKLGEANVRHLTSSGDGNISVCGTLYYVQNTKNCISSIKTIILILVYRYHNALELIKLSTFRLTVLQSSYECRHHHWHWQYVYVTFRISYVACLTFHIVSCYTHLVCWYE